MDALGAARELHQAGRLEEAERIYRQVVAGDPGRSQAWHSLGVIALQTGRGELAADLIGKAVRIESSNPYFLDNLGVALRSLGRIKEAERRHRAALAAKPDMAAAHSNLGIALHEQGNARDAETCFRRALKLDPEMVDAMNNLSVLLREAGRLEESEQVLREALARRPDLAEAHVNLGNVLRMLGRLEQAEQSCRQAIALKPGFAEALVSLGMVLEALRRPAEAEQALRQALALRPRYLDALIRLGNVLWELGRTQDAEQSYRDALSLQPHSALAHNNLGIALSALGRLEEAEAAYRQALAIEPAFSDAHGNLGNALRDMGRLEEAGACFRKALQVAPASASAHLNEAIYRLLLGDYAAGWREYEWRWKDRSVRPDLREFSPPLWTGAEDLRGKTLWLHAEQGLGDAIQFARYAPLAAQRGAKVLLEVPEALAGPLARIEGVERVFAAGGGSPEADFHCPLMSLPLAFGTASVDAVPSPGPYLGVESAAAAAWRAKLSPDGARLVGLCWKGNPRNRNDRNRSARLADFLPLLETRGVRFVSLQQELDADELALLAGRTNLVHDSLPLGEKAALAGALDLVISVDTLWAHWAGAIGKPLWVVLSLVPAWCWLLDRADSPWYASARLFRQTRRGDWAGVIGNVARELTQP